MDLAFKLFEKHGIEQVSINMIADRLEIAKGTVYKHFKSKDELFAIYCREYLMGMNEQLKKVDRSGDVFLQLHYMTSTFLDYCMSRPNAYRAYIDCRSALHLEKLRIEYKESLVAMYSEQAKLIESVISQGQEKGRLREDPIPYLSCIGIGMLEGAMNSVLNSPLDIKIEDSSTFLSLCQGVLARGIKKSSKKRS